MDRPCTWNWWPLHACGEVIAWGDVATWLATAGAALAVFFAIRAYRLEIARDRQRDDEARSRQAEQVSAWMQGETKQYPQGLAVKLLIHNGSGQPIYSFSALLLAADETIPILTPGLVPPGDESVWISSEDAMRALDKEMRNPDNPSAYREDWDFHLQNIRVAISFTDAIGRIWHRNEHGILHQQIC